MSHMSKQETLATQQEGYRAYLAGLAPTENPYPLDTEPERKTAWFRGYAASKTDRARANREAAKK